MEDNKHYVP